MLFPRSALALFTLAVLTSACGSSPAIAEQPSATPNPFNATACKHFQTGLQRLEENLADGKKNGYLPIGLQVDVPLSKQAVDKAAQLAEGEARSAMERTAAAISALGVAVEDTWQDGMDIAQEVTTLGLAVEAVRPLCAAAGSPVTITFS
ncbi:hypothetical protein AB0O34_10050 [Sphaerisporangium sp. NPDC088356]|uniref:hypothetical protein n=1 Tax=Sphaerisporangium sp. NPDC088356 TaxID=3154871 RepID=UPI003427C067